MDETPTPGPPAWVHKRDGRLVPFDADKISRALFTATESLGHPDAFLARELADGVVHFLTAESEGTTPTTEQIAELVVKVVRELGQPALAEAFARSAARRRAAPRPGTAPEPREAGPAAPPGEVVLRFSPETPLPDVLAICVRDYTLQTVFTRDLVAARGDGLLTLTGLEMPTELGGCVLGPPLDPAGVVAAVEELRRFVGGFVVLDGPDHLLAAGGRPDAAVFVRDFTAALRLARLRGVVNLNSAAPPPWAGELAEGPLFASQSRAPHGETLRRLADELAAELLRSAHFAPVGIDWHLGERDFGPEDRERLRRLARAALAGAPLAFVFDRPRRPVALAEGIDRKHPAVLMTVRLCLSRLAAQPGVGGAPDKFLAKLGSLARLALSAGVQKREYLRRLERARPPAAGGPALTSGFLLDRARLVVCPMGLDDVVSMFHDKGLAAGGAALDFGRQIVQRLRDVLRQDGRNVHLDTCLDGRSHFGRRGAEAAHHEEAEAPAAWGPPPPLKNQLRAAGVLHGVTEHGTLALSLPDEGAPTAEEVADLLHTAWRQTDIVRLRLDRREAATEQLTFLT